MELSGSEKSQVKKPVAGVSKNERLNIGSNNNLGKNKAASSIIWKKVGIVCVVLATLILVVTLIILFIHKANTVTPEQAREKASELTESARKTYGNGNKTSKEEAKRLFKDKIDSSKGNQRFYYILAYIYFSAARGMDVDECYRYIDEAEGMINGDETLRRDYMEAKCFAYDFYRNNRLYTECIDVEGSNDEQ